MNTIRTKTWTLSPRQLCDVECILSGIFAPLTGFLIEKDYLTVCDHMRLYNGSLWPIPITLDVSTYFADTLTLNEEITLVDEDNTPIAILTVQSIWQPNKREEAERIFGTADDTHPGVHYLFYRAGNTYLGGKLTLLSMPRHYDFTAYRQKPADIRELYSQQLGFRQDTNTGTQSINETRVVAFQTRNPMHRAHYELTRRASSMLDAHLLIQPVVGMTKPGDIDYVTRVKCYIALLNEYPVTQCVSLNLLPLAMRMAGPREALWHALIRKNYGVTHFIVGRDHAGPGQNRDNLPFYAPYAAQQLVTEFAHEIPMTILPFSEIVYVPERKIFLLKEELRDTDTTTEISGSALRHKLRQGESIPEWFTFPAIANILRHAYPPKKQTGFTVFFTGLSGAGKSTLAKALQAQLHEQTTRRVTLLDGDSLRKNISSELGFSPEEREIHIRRMGYLASEITKHHGIAICAAIAPCASAREAVREQVSAYGTFFEIYVATSLEACEKRDTKGLYKKARAGIIPNFTGISAPYEQPLAANLVIDTSSISVEEAVSIIWNALIDENVCLPVDAL